MKLRTQIAVYTPPNLGGVKSVTKSLAVGLRKNGYDVLEFSSLSKFFYYGFRKKSVGIASLKAGFLTIFFWRSIYIVHGFPMVGVQNNLERWLINLAAKFALFFGSKTVAVSYLTKAVNEKIFGVKIHEVIHNGASELFFRNSIQLYEKTKYVLFVGRFIKTKGVLNVIQAFNASRICEKGYRLKLIGNGDLLPEMKSMDEGRNFDFLIDCDELTKADCMRKAEVFISLHDFEPMGVVFVEALLSRCKIISPHSGGQSEFIPHGYPHFKCDPANLDSISNALVQATVQRDFDYEMNEKIFSYPHHIAKRYINTLDI